MKNTKSQEETNQFISSFVNYEENDFYLQGDFEIGTIIDCENAIHCCKFSPNGDIFAVGLSDGSIKIYKKQNFQLIYTLIDDEIKLTRLPVTNIKFFNKPNDLVQDHYKIIVATYVSGYIKFWHYPSKSCIYTILDKDTQPLTLDFNKSFERLAIGGYDSKVKIYDVETKKLANILENSDFGSSISGHSSRVYCVKYSPSENNRLFSGGWDDTVQIWDDRVSNSINLIYGPHICGDSIDIDSNHNHMITGSWRKTSALQIWDLRNYELVRDVFRDKSSMMIYSCQWLAHNCIFVCGSEKNSAIIYDRGTLKPIGGLYDLKHAVTSIDNDRSGDVPNLIACSENKLFFIRKKMLNHNLSAKSNNYKN